MVLTKTEISMIKEAQKNNNNRAVYPAGNKKSFDECFTYEKDMGLLILWYDKDIDCGRTTGVITQPLPN